MSSFTKNKLKDLLRPRNIPKVPKGTKSANTSPRCVKSIDFNSCETANLSSSNKSTCLVLLKSLSDLSTHFESMSKRSKDFDKELIDMIQSCEKSLNSARVKLFELSSDDDYFRSIDSRSFQDLSSLVKPEFSEYAQFLEYLLLYEQTKNEIIILKTKYPKSKLPEIEKTIFQDYGLKFPGYNNPSKPLEINLFQKCKKEISDYTSTIKKKLSKSIKIPDDILSLLSQVPEDFSIPEPKTPSLQKIINDNKSYQKDYKKLKDSYESSIEDNKRLSCKYNYLISRLNKQESTLNRQSRILKSFAQDPEWLREQINKFKEEMNFYMSLLRTHMVECESGKLSYTHLLHENAVLQNENKKITEQLEKIKKNHNDLEIKLKAQVEENFQLRELKEISEDSLNLGFSVSDLMEIQGLKEQIRVLTFKASESQNKLKIELDSYRAQVNKLKAEKFSLEERLKSLNLKYCDLENENQRINDDLGKFKTSNTMSSCAKPIPMLSGDTFNVCEPSDSFGRVNPADVFSVANYEIEEIIEALKAHSVFPELQNSHIELLRKLASFVIALKENLDEEPRDFCEIIQELIQDYKTRVTSNDRAFALGTESFLNTKQIEIYRTKLKDKKNQLELCNQQISYLKKSLKESKEEVSKANPIDVECIRDMFGSIIREVAQLNPKTETLIEVLMKTLGFSGEMILKIAAERKSRRNSGFLKGLF